MAEPTTVIGEFTSVQGNLQGDEDLLVLGRVEGSIQLERTLMVEQTGVVKADVSVRNAVISGVVVGNISASESVHLASEGRMVGDISAPRVILVEGALFRGRIDMGETQPSHRDEGKEESRPAVRSRKPAPSRARPAARKTQRTSPASSTRLKPKVEEELEEVVEEEVEEPKPKAKPKPRPSRRFPARSKSKAKIEVDDSPKGDSEEKSPPPPKPRIAPKKRRVSVKKKR